MSARCTPKRRFDFDKRAPWAARLKSRSSPDRSAECYRIAGAGPREMRELSGDCRSLRTASIADAAGRRDIFRRWQRRWLPAGSFEAESAREIQFAEKGFVGRVHRVARN